MLNGHAKRDANVCETSGGPIWNAKVFRRPLLSTCLPSLATSGLAEVAIPNTARTRIYWPPADG